MKILQKLTKFSFMNLFQEMFSFPVSVRISSVKTVLRFSKVSSYTFFFLFFLHKNPTKVTYIPTRKLSNKMFMGH